MEINSGELLFGIFAFFVWLATFIYAFAAIKIVDQGHNYTVERLGKYTRTLYPGFNAIIPFLDCISHKVSIKEQLMEIPSQEVVTQDNVVVDIDGIMFFQVLKASDAIYAVDDFQIALERLAITSLRAVISSFGSDNLLSKREEINFKLLTLLDDATVPWGIKILRFELKDIYLLTGNAKCHLYDFDHEKFIKCNCSECRFSKSPYFYMHKTLKRYESKKISSIRCNKSLKEVEVSSLLYQPSNNKEYSIQRKKELFEEINKRYDLEELKTLCFMLDIGEEFTGDKATHVRKMIQWLESRDRLSELEVLIKTK